MVGTRLTRGARIPVRSVPPAAAQDRAPPALTRPWSLGAPAEVGLLSLSALLFALSFPSFVSPSGWFPVAYVALAPLFVALRSATWPRTLLYGPAFGFASYALFNYWLAKFHPITIFVVPPIHAVYYLALLVALKAADRLYPRGGFAVQTLVWVAYEYLKIQGFLGYPWGVLGYSQYSFLPLIGVVRLGGVWIVSLLVVFPSATVAALLTRGRSRAIVVAALLYAAAMAAAIGYGTATRVNVAADPTRRFALIQQNADPWKTDYARTLESLISLSDRALTQEPDIVVWSETSFVPAIDWHRRYRVDRERYLLVERLLEYLGRQQVPFVVGNDDGQRRRNSSGLDLRVDYNAALLFVNGEIRQTYRKLHLVPFTEHFPFERTLPRIYQSLATNPDIHFWERGEETTVFEAAGMRFSTPICFEDSFGYLSRNFVRAGAEVIVNLTNDSWSNSVVAEMQHMSMAVFRAVENARSVVRSTNGGMTVTIDPNGRILSVLEPFTESYLVSDVPIHVSTRTLYTSWGDWVAKTVLAAAVFLLLVGIGLRVIGRARNRRPQPAT